MNTAFLLMAQYNTLEINFAPGPRPQEKADKSVEVATDWSVA